MTGVAISERSGEEDLRGVFFGKMRTCGLGTRGRNHRQEINKSEFGDGRCAERTSPSLAIRGCSLIPEQSHRETES